MKEPTDEHLMRMVSAGRMAALGQVYDRYERPLLAFLFRRTAGTAPVEDLLQEVFLRVIKYRSSYDPDRPFRSWIFRIAHNVAIDARNKASDVDLAEAPNEPTAESEDPVERIAAERRTARIRAALDRLSESDRRVLSLAKVEGLRYAEVAEILKCSEGAVKVRVHRALHRLAAHLDPPPDTRGG